MLLELRCLSLFAAIERGWTRVQRIRRFSHRFAFRVDRWFFFSFCLTFLFLGKSSTLLEIYLEHFIKSNTSKAEMMLANSTTIGRLTFLPPLLEALGTLWLAGFMELSLDLSKIVYFNLRIWLILIIKFQIIEVKPLM